MAHTNKVSGFCLPFCFLVVLFSFVIVLRVCGKAGWRAGGLGGVAGLWDGLARLWLQLGRSPFPRTGISVLW